MEKSLKYPELFKIIEETSPASSSRRFESYLRKERILSFISGEKKILDVGCGWAVLGNYLSRQGYNVTAVDKCSEYIEKAQEVSRRYNTKISLKICPAEGLGLADASFDLVIWEEMLEHLEDPIIALKEGMAVLKDKGKFILSVPNLGSLRSKIFMLLGKEGKLGCPEHLHNFNYNSAIAMVKKSGFKLISVTSDFIPIPKIPIGFCLNLRKQLAYKYPSLGHHIIIFGEKP